MCSSLCVRPKPDSCSWHRAKHIWLLLVCRNRKIPPPPSCRKHPSHLVATRSNLTRDSTCDKFLLLILILNGVKWNIENNHVVHSVRVTLLCSAAPVTRDPCQCECFADRWALGGLGGSYKLIFTKAVYGWVDGFVSLFGSAGKQATQLVPFSPHRTLNDNRVSMTYCLSKHKHFFLQSRPDGEAVQWRASGRTDIVRNRPVILQRQPEENLLWRSLSPVFAVVAYLNYWTKNESSCRNSIFF